MGTTSYTHAACYTRFSARKQAQETGARKTGRKRNEEIFEQDFLNKLVCGLKIISAFNSVQAFRRKMNEMCEEEDKDKV